MTNLTLTPENADLFVLFKDAKAGDSGSLSIDYNIESISDSEVQLKLSRIESNASPAEPEIEEAAPEECPKCGEPLNSKGNCDACGWRQGDDVEKEPEDAGKKPFAVLIGR